MKTSVIFLLLAFPLLAAAQVNNGGFESLDGWHVVEGEQNLKQNRDANSGTFSGLIYTSNDKTMTLENHEYYPFSGSEQPAGHPTSLGGPLTGAYSYRNSASGCSDATVAVLIFRYNDDDEVVVIASGSASLEPNSDWTNFSVDLDEELPLTEDARVTVSFTTGEGCEIGSCCFLSLDNLRLGGGKPPHQRDDKGNNTPDGRK